MSWRVKSEIKDLMPSSLFQTGSKVAEFLASFPEGNSLLVILEVVKQI